MKIIIFLILLISIFSNSYLNQNWTAENFLTGEFENNLGSLCKLEAKDGKITGEYFTKPSRAELVQPGFPVTGVYTPVEDGALVTMNVVFKMVKEKEDDLEVISHTTWNGKIYSNKKQFKLTWLINSNQIEENEWVSTNIGQDLFIKIK